MPVVPHVSYPGVYIQEVESDVHTIVPVETATTAFIGRAIRGPVDKPTVINSYADFQRDFGRLGPDNGLGYAVNQFFLNGGSKAVIVRLYHPPANGDQGNARIEIPGGLDIKAKNPGAWGSKLCVRVTYPDAKLKKQLEEKYTQDNVTFDDLFNLIVHDLGTGVTEQFDNLTFVDGPRRVDKVLEKDSKLVSFDGTLSETRPPRPDAHQDQPGVGKKSVWEDDLCCTKAGNSVSDSAPLDAEDLKAGIGLLEKVKGDHISLLYIPPTNEGEDIDSGVLDAAAAYCEKHRAFLLVDSPSSWINKDAREEFPDNLMSTSANAAVFFPRIKVANPLRDNQVEEYGPCGAIAGIFARTDATRGVWKAPAGIDATLKGVTGLTVELTDAENGELNPRGINCLRKMPAAGYVVWGARTLKGDDQLADQWKYIPVRRTALFIEESLYRGTQWAVFEPNDEPLWSQLRLNTGVFMHNLFRQGAFQGASPKEAYFVKCDKTTTTQADIDGGIVNIIVGFAPLKPAEFVILYIQQIAGQLTA